MFIEPEKREAWTTRENTHTLDEASKLLLKAAALIEERGWCQGSMLSPSGYCALGAIGVAGDYRDIAYKARDKFSAVVGSVATWNDWPGRTKEEVIAKLRSVAIGG